MSQVKASKSNSNNDNEKRSPMAIYQRCQQPTSRKVLLQLHQLPLLPRPLTARPPPRGYKSFRLAPRAGSCNCNCNEAGQAATKPKANPSATSTAHGTRCGANEDKRLCQNPIRDAFSELLPLPPLLSTTLFLRPAKIVCLSRPGRPVG